ncbi:MAG: hypothetical protein JXR71_02060 [Bacteroidales bacterium]|nr:hypothetical protein [Bacteroidales bacterium]
MKMKPTLIVMGLILTLFACSRNSGVLNTDQPTPSNSSLKSSIASSNSGHMTLHFRAVNNHKFERSEIENNRFEHHRGAFVENFDSAGGRLTTITLVRDGNPRLGIGGKSVVVWNQVEYFNDLLYMGTGMMGDLAIIDIPSGIYNKAIVAVTDGWVAKDGKVYPLKFPSNRMVLDFDPAVIVGMHVSPDIIFNIDVSRSFIPIKGGTSYVFKPIVKVVNATTAGSLIGFVADPTTGQPVGGAYVSVNANGQTYDTYSANQIIINGTDTLYPGQYYIPGIPAGGPYTATAAASGYSTASAQVSILKGNFNWQEFYLMPQ